MILIENNPTDKFRGNVLYVLIKILPSQNPERNILLENLPAELSENFPDKYSEHKNFTGDFSKFRKFFIYFKPCLQI